MSHVTERFYERPPSGVFGTSTDPISWLDTAGGRRARKTNRSSRPDHTVGRGANLQLMTATGYRVLIVAGCATRCWRGASESHRNLRIKERAQPWPSPSGECPARTPVAGAHSGRRPLLSWSTSLSADRTTRFPVACSRLHASGSLTSTVAERAGTESQASSVISQPHG